VGFTDQGAAGNVTDGQAGQVALLFGVTQRCKGICSLAGLGDGNEKGIGWYRHLAVAILTGDFYLTRQPCLLFYPVPSHKTGVIAGAAGDDVDVLDVFQPGFRLGAEDGSEYVILAQCAFQRIGYGDGLFVDFFEHEVAVLALVQAVSGVLVTQYRVVHQLVLPVPDFSGLQRQPGVVALLQIDELIGYLQQGQGVGGYESFFAAFTYDQRAAHTCTVQGIGLVLVDNPQGVSTVEFGQGGAEGAKQVLFLAVVVGQQVGDYFGVGFRGEGVAQLLELLTQLVVVFDDAVVDYGQPLGQVRMGVVFGGFAVGGPAGVGYAQVAVNGCSFQGIFQLDDLADCAGAFDAVAGGQDGDAGGVIAAVFEAAQAFYEDGGDVAFGDGAYYSAHG